MVSTRLSPLEPPTLAIPVSANTCSVSIVDTSCVLTVPGDTLVEPTIPGHELMNFPTLAFLIENIASGTQVLFDLGCRKDFWNLPSPIAEVIDAKVPGIKVDKGLVDILKDGGVDVAKLDAAIISHHHYDHFGDPKTFPASMDLLVGPGFNAKFMPGYPSAPEAPMFESDLAGRAVREVSFEDSLSVAGYRAIDHFGDGSFYILDTPGHAIGHLSALVRTTTDTFIFLGGDICHFGGSFRPTPYIPMPDQLHPEQVGHPGEEPYNHTIFTRCHPDQANCQVSPYYVPCCRQDSWYVDPVQAQQSINQLKILDADPRILILIAHDPAVLNVVTFFPHGSANNWYKQGWKQALHWRFLDELPSSIKERKYLVDGTYINSTLCKTLDGVRVGTQ